MIDEPSGSALQEMKRQVGVVINAMTSLPKSTIRIPESKVEEALTEEEKRERSERIRAAYSLMNMMRKVYGPALRDLAARQKGIHEVHWTYWPAKGAMPVRHCSCGLVVDAPDLIDPTSPAGDAASAIDGRWPTDEAERQRVMDAFLNTPGHIDWAEKDPEKFGMGHIDFNPAEPEPRTQASDSEAQATK